MSIPAINVGAVFTSAAPTIWSLQAIEDRLEATPLEMLKEYTNSIFRDDENEKNMYPNPNKQYQRDYHVEHRLIGRGVTGTNQLIENEEKVRGKIFTFSPQYVRNAIAFNETTINTDIILADYARQDRKWLAEWAARRHQINDLSRMILGTTNIKYGNGSVASLNTITSSNVLGDPTFYTLSRQFTQNNTKAIKMMHESFGNYEYPFYVALFDESVLQSLLQDSSWKTFMESFFQNYGFKNPLSEVSYGMRQNILLVKLESEEGFGSALRPALIAADAVAGSIANSGNSDINVGLPDLVSGTTYTAYVPDGKVDFIKYLSDILTITGTTSSGITGCYVQPHDGSAPVGPMTIKAGSTAYYTINLTNLSGGAYVPAAGDRFVFPVSAALGMGAEAYVSSYSSPMVMIPDNTDYQFNKGMSVNFWEGGTPIKNVRNITSGLALDFFYVDPTK